MTTDFAFLSDDFTGGIDVVLQLARRGHAAVLWVTEEPTAEEILEHGSRYVGFASTARKESPEVSAATIRRFERFLASITPRAVQYKICSTADSSPSLGSIGGAVKMFRNRYAGPVGLLVAQPALGRYTCFSNHFAAEDGTVYRLDRQPTMSRHPSTPMHEADLRRHFERQVDGSVGAIHLTDLASMESLDIAWKREVRRGAALIILDALNEQDLVRYGNYWASAAGGPVAVVGSGGATISLAGLLSAADPSAPGVPEASPANGPALVLAGSMSPNTRRQIDAVSAATTWRAFPLGPEWAAVDPGRMAESIRRELCGGRNVLVHSMDLRVQGDERADGDAIAGVLAELARSAKDLWHRLVIAGGDTSGTILRLLGVRSLRLKATVEGVTCLCDAAGGFDGETVEVVLKGGQLGSRDYFLSALGNRQSNAFN